MAGNLKQAEFLADTLAHKITKLLTERNNLRTELARKSSGSLERDKAFVQAYKHAVIDRAYSDMKASRLEHLLLIR